MPCDTIQTTGVEIANPHMDSLMRALDALDLRPQLSSDKNSITFRNGSFANGKLSVRSNTFLASDIRARYAQELGATAAKKYGFRMEPIKQRTPGALATFKLTK